MIRKKYILLLGCCLWLSAGGFCQNPDSTSAGGQRVGKPTLPGDSTDLLVPKKKKGRLHQFFSKDDYPNPKKALYLSLAVPGAGQLYNKRWWKLPFVYGGYTLLILAIDHNTKGYRAFRDAYIAELAGQEHRYSLSGLDAGDLRRLRDGYDKSRQLSYIGLLAFHIIQTADAFVDCHLKTFDVSDDLSLRIGPAATTLPNGQSYFGLGIQLGK